MRMNRRVALAASVGMVAFTAACSDSTTAPQVAAVATRANFATGDVTNTGIPVPVTGKLIVCKTGNVGGSFTFTRSTIGTVVGSTWVGAGPIVIANGTCLEVANDASLSGSGSNITITEGAAPPNTVQSVASCSFRGVDLAGVLQPPVPCNFVNGGEVFLNSFHGYVITYNNVFTPPPPPVCDFSTFGGYTLTNNYNISYGGNAGIIESGVAFGSLNFVNHTTGDHIHVWNVTGYVHPASGPLSGYPDSRMATGTGTINGAGSFPVEWRFVDLGEPGSNDRVYLKVNGVVLIQEQPVQGGNVQLHNLCKKTPTADKH